jgi:hypothetical protein
MDNWTIGRDEIVGEWGSCNRDKPENTPASRMSSWECGGSALMDMSGRPL